MKTRKQTTLTRQKKDAILKEANRLFSRHGIAGTTIDEIAEAVGFCKATVYAHFLGKEDIVLHLMAHCQNVSRERIAELERECGDFSGFVLAACEYSIKLYGEYPVCMEGFFGNLSFSGGGETSDAVKQSIRRNGKAINAIFLRVIRKNIDNGVLRDDLTPQEIFFTLWSCFYGLLGMAKTPSDYIAYLFPGDRDTLLRCGLASILRVALKGEVGEKPPMRKPKK